MLRNRLIVLFRGEGRVWNRPFKWNEISKGITKRESSKSKRTRSRLSGYLSNFHRKRVRGVYYLLEHDGGKYSKNRLPEFNAPTTCIGQKVRRWNIARETRRSGSIDSEGFCSLEFDPSLSSREQKLYSLYSCQLAALARIIFFICPLAIHPRFVPISWTYFDSRLTRKFYFGWIEQQGKVCHR